MSNMMLINPDLAVKADLLVVLLCENDPLPKSLVKIDKALMSGITFNIRSEGFTGKLQQTLLITTNGMCAISKVLLIGVGSRSAITSLRLQEIGGQVAAALRSHSANHVLIDTTALEQESGAALLAFGMRLKAWSFNKYSEDPSSTLPQHIQFICNEPESQMRNLLAFEKIAEAILNAREMISEPANILYPEAFAERCQELNAIGLQVEVLDEEQLEELGMHALLSVGQGSTKPPRVVTLQWKGGESSQPPIALVGKGVCYDSGGISIKTSHMVEMKWDKAGAGAVLGTLQALAMLQAPVNVVGVLGLVENMPDGNALKPGDIISSLAGKTIEVVDTDNEGRLVLADCMCYAQQKFSPEVVIDLGTLTLEVFGVLAGEYAGLFCDDPQLTQELMDAGEVSGERLWSLPMGEPFAKQIRSSVAHIKNMGILGFGESAAAAEFLKCFVQPGVKWAHLDIAGVAWSQEELPLSSPGVTAFGVRLLTSWLLQRCAKFVPVPTVAK